jgi:hypothetical protein
VAVEAVDVVVSALTAGAAVGMKEAATAAMKDAYAGLVEAIRRRLGHRRAEELVALVQEHAADPAARREELVAALTAADAATNDKVVAAARRVLAEVDPVGIQGGKYTVDAREAKGVQVGDDNTMTLNF